MLFIQLQLASINTVPKRPSTEQELIGNSIIGRVVRPNLNARKGIRANFVQHVISTDAVTQSCPS